MIPPVSNQALLSALEQSPSMVLISDLAGVIAYVNAKFERVTGRPRASVLGVHTRTLKSGLNEPSLYRDLWLTLLRGEAWRGEFHNRRQDSTTFWERAVVTPLRDQEGRVTHYLKVSDMLAASDDERAHADHLALHDLLTGLPNRSLFSDRLTQALQRDQIRGFPTGVFLLGVDGFSQVNETLGHVSGDRVLQMVARRLEGVMGESDTLARIASDEFGFLPQELRRAEDVGGYAMRLQRAFEQPFRVGTQNIELSVSVGIAVAPNDGFDADTLIQRANAALRSAKSAGGGHVHSFTPGLEARAQERLRLVSDLRHALRDGGLTLAFQPRVNLNTGSVVGFEALARWHHPTHGNIPPTQFIRLAEGSALIHVLGDEVLRMALQQLRDWRAAGLAVRPVAVNLSATEFARQDLVERVLEALRAHALPGHLLELELTETTAMVDVARTIETVGKLRRMGVSVAIDDFGIGQTSLAHLQLLPVHALKVDRSFVAEADHTNPRNTAILRAIVDLGNALDLQVTAEGVETEAQRQTLIALGFECAQGFLLGRPMPGHEATALLN